MENTLPKLSKGKIIQYSVADFAKGIFLGLIGTYLVYFYQPPTEAGLPALLPYATTLTLLTAISKIFDIISDPIVAKYTDRCKSKYGRRMPFLRWVSLPYALSALLIFFPPFKEGSPWNAVWVCLFLIIFYFCHTLYFLPQRALVPEVIREPNERVKFYSLATTFFIAATCLMYLTTLFVDLLKGAGLAPITSWRIVFGGFAVLGFICLLLSAFAFNEKKYAVNQTLPNESLINSFKVVLKNKEFVMFSLSDLFSHTALASFQTALMYYITMLIGMPESQSYIVMICEFAAALVCFPLISKMTEKMSKKVLMVIATIVFTALFVVMFFGHNIAELLVGKEVILGIVMGIIVSFPFAAIHVIPPAMLSDIIQADTIRNGINREGVFSAVRDFMEKLAHALAMILVTSVVLIGTQGDEKVALLGVKVTTIVSGVLCIISAILYWFYSDKEVMNIIKQHIDDDSCEEMPHKITDCE